MDVTSFLNLTSRLIPFFSSGSQHTVIHGAGKFDNYWSTTMKATNIYGLQLDNPFPLPLLLIGKFSFCSIVLNMVDFFSTQYLADLV